MKFHSGQTMTEYVLVLSALFAVTALIWYLTRTTESATVRAERLIGADVP